MARPGVTDMLKTDPGERPDVGCKRLRLTSLRHTEDSGIMSESGLGGRRSIHWWW